MEVSIRRRILGLSDSALGKCCGNTGTRFRVMTDEFCDERSTADEISPRPSSQRN
jgi:hypothetical protein